MIALLINDPALKTEYFGPPHSTYQRNHLRPTFKLWKTFYTSVFCLSANNKMPAITFQGDINFFLPASQVGTKWRILEEIWEEIIQNEVKSAWEEAPQLKSPYPIATAGGVVDVVATSNFSQKGKQGYAEELNQRPLLLKSITAIFMPSSGCPAAQSLKLSFVRTPALFHLQLFPLIFSPIECHPLISALPV